ncbi:hypothetical protein AWW67_13820 [Roseivirga seohaensis]|uniref:Uncharacterized protein n=1 Tax=Roseivirga seohaensis TaxID=1914963 RepID=A0A150XLD6_9BACT|nr:GDSL-type esterase/lipase family protein [Roseivirga seohaensis]KYG79442.1 hypothetical protein AWW67_13820 [Roseivirga seohaensis]
MKPHNDFYPLEPNLNVKETFNGTHLFPGLTDVFTYTTNNQGYRSDSKFDESRFGILALGGSTTECLTLGDHNIWTNLLEEKLNLNSDLKFTVGNIGASGLNSRHHLQQLLQLHKKYSGLKAVMLLVGINDFLLDLHFPNKEIDSLSIARSAFKQYPRRFNIHWYERTEIYMHLKKVKHNWINNRFDDKNDIVFTVENYRERLKNLSPTLALPDLSNNLTKYKNNIAAIYSYCIKNDLELILVTQPVLWHKNMSNYEWELTATAIKQEGTTTYSPQEYEKGMEMYNDVLRDFEEKDKVTLIDLSFELPKDTTVFFDFCHFNIQGAKKVSDVIFDNISAKFLP